MRCVTLPAVLVLVGATPGWSCGCPPGGHGEVPRRNHGEAAGTKLGSSSVERAAVNTGTVPVLTRAGLPARIMGWVHRRPIGSGRGGAAVVLRGRESRSPGEGRQRKREDKDAVMPKDPPVNTGGPVPGREPWVRVSGMQAKLHRWAVADPGRRFDDLFNFVHDPATLRMAFARVASNTGANTPGVDGLTVAAVEEARRCCGVPGRSAGTGQGRLVSSVAGAPTIDPERPRFGEAAKFGHPHHR